MAARGDPYNLSCLMSSLHKEATACFGALPVDEHSTFSPVEFRTMLRQHLQISNPAVTANPTLLCACKKQMDNLNRLVSCCKCQNHLTINVHNEVQRVLAELASASKTQCTVKVRKMYEALNPGVNKEADLIMDGALAVDVRISAVGSKEITMRTAAQPDYTVLRGEREKRSQYNVVKDQTMFQLVPFVVDSQGHMGPEAKGLFSKLCHRVAFSSNIPISIIQSYWVRKLSCRLMKAIARRAISKVEMALSLQLSHNFAYNGVHQSDSIRHVVVDSLSGMSPRDSDYW